MNFVTRCTLTVLFAFAAVVLGASAHAAENISKVNGSVKVEPGQQVGDVDTVNGSVTIGAGARAGDVETVNGSLKIEDKAVVGSAETVNGSITVGAEAEGKGLMEVFAAMDPGSSEDWKLVDAWAERLGLSGWYKWIPHELEP